MQNCLPLLTFVQRQSIKLHVKGAGGKGGGRVEGQEREEGEKRREGSAKG